jgi:hypothetical protein
LYDIAKEDGPNELPVLVVNFDPTIKNQAVSQIPTQAISRAFVTAFARAASKSGSLRARPTRRAPAQGHIGKIPRDRVQPSGRRDSKAPLRWFGTRSSRFSLPHIFLLLALRFGRALVQKASTSAGKLPARHCLSSV